MLSLQPISKRSSATVSPATPQRGTDPVGFILDTSILIASERRREPVEGILRRVRALHGEVDVALSAVSVVELTHGMFRARTSEQRERRRIFAEGALQDLIVHPFSLEIAQLAGKIEGEQAARGIVIGFEDLLIGATALHLGFGVATLNVKHFQLIPGLQIVQL
ncbi:PIN domain-containing protein [Silvibacterium sp.]|uniref:PIN domain-containing protein n=1 Tax=Silvibacterium sp. TaxID=1964179 RepID=UPI0039E69EA2